MRYLGRKSSSGFTVVELLAGVTVVGFLAIATNSAINAPRPDLELQNAIHSVDHLVQKSHREAMARGVRAVIWIEPETNDLVAFADVNGKPSPANASYSRYLVFDPDPILLSARQTDYEIGRVQLPEGIRFAVPTEFADVETVSGLTRMPHSKADAKAVVISQRGKVLNSGSIRLMDESGRNVLEAALLDMTGRVTVRKYLRAEHAPNGQAGFVADASGESIWAWY